MRFAGDTGRLGRRLGSTGRAVLLVAGGTMLAQAIAAAVTPLLTRLYGPETLGILATVLAYAGVIGPVAGLCLPIAIVLAADPRQVVDLAHASRACALVVGVLAAGAAPIFLDDALRSGVPWFLVVVAIATLIVSSVLMQVAQQQIIAMQDFSLLGVLLVAQALVFSAAQVGAGLVRSDATLLVAVSCTYSAVFIIMAHSHPRYRRLRAKGDGSSSTWATIRRWGDFPRFRAPQVLLSTVAIHLPTLLLAALVDIRWSGLFMITYRVLALPVLFVGKAISDVIYPQTVALVRSGSPSLPLVGRWMMTAGLIATPVVLVLVFAGERLFAGVLGPDWGQAGVLAQAMIAWMVGALVSRPAVGAVPVLGLQRHYLISDSVAVIARSVILGVMLRGGVDVVLSIFVWSVLSAGGAFWISGMVLLRARRMPDPAWERTSTA